MTDLTPEEQARADEVDRYMSGVGLLDTWDKYGRRITHGQAMTLYRRGMDDPDVEWYPRVGLDHVGGYEISTVWMFMDHGAFMPGAEDGPVAIFETMVFAVDENYDRTAASGHVIERYADLGSAVDGHQRAIRMIQDSPVDWFAVVRDLET